MPHMPSPKCRSTPGAFVCGSITNCECRVVSSAEAHARELVAVSLYLLAYFELPYILVNYFLFLITGMYYYKASRFGF